MRILRGDSVLFWPERESSHNPAKHQSISHQSIHQSMTCLMVMGRKSKKEVRDGEAETQQEIGYSLAKGGGGARGGAGGGRGGTEDDTKHLV